jgi:hypothetical protein
MVAAARRITNEKSASRFHRQERQVPPIQTTADGAFMEPRGCKRLQAVTNGIAAEPAEHANPLPWVATDCV